METTRTAGLLRGTGMTFMAGAMLLSTALPPPPAQASPSAGPACLIGSWTSVSLDGHMRSMIGSIRPGLTIEDVTGTMRLQFRDDATFSQRLDHVTVRSRMSGMAAVQTIDGEASGRFEDDGADALTVSGESAALTMDMELDGTPVATGVDMSGLALASREYGPSHATYSCSADRLELTSVMPDGRPVSPMIFARAR